MEPLYVVLVINLIVWGGIFFYMMHLGQRMKELKSKLHKLTNNASSKEN